MCRGQQVKTESIIMFRPVGLPNSGVSTAGPSRVGALPNIQSAHLTWVAASKY